MKKALILLVLSIFLIFSCDLNSGRARNVVLYEFDGSTDESLIENEYLELRFFPQTTEIVLTDKISGAKWRSNPAGDDPFADTVTTYLQKSLFTVEYADAAGVGQTLFSSEQSVELHSYQYNISDNVLEVNYTVGSVERNFIIPPAATEERFKQVTEKMAGKDKTTVQSSYRLYDINNLRPNDNKSELLASYPDLSRRKLYILRSNTPEYQKIEYEKIFEEAGYTYDDYLDDISNYSSISGKEKPAFNITLCYSLDGRSLIVDVPLDKISYRPEYPVVRVSVLPLMGAGSLNDEGYLMVPDGSGALIYFNNGKQNQLIYSSNVYGWDEGLMRSAVIVDNRSAFPVFGIQNNNNALICITENGASYSNIRAGVSGFNSSYNYVYPCFDMVHNALMNISGRSERDIYQYERTLPAGEHITLRYVICNQDGYVGMAKEYRAWLLDKFPFLKAQKNGSAAVPIAVEIPGAVNKVQHILGIPFDLPLKLTSYNEMEEMEKDFTRLGWKNVRIKLNGWFNKSVDHSIPLKLKLIKELGNKKDFTKFIKAAEQDGHTIYGEADFLFMKDKKPFDGFSIYRDTARYVSRQRIQKYPFSFVWFGERTNWGKLSYVARPSFMMSTIDKFIVKAGNLGVKNIAFRNIGSKLAGDYNERRHVSRESSMLMRQKKLDELKNGGTGIMLLTGNSYAAPFADFIVDVPIFDQNYRITDVSIPFYPIALHGLVPFTGKAINLAEDYTKFLLKIVESGSGLYFSFITEDASILQETKFRQFYANEYKKWIGDADAFYKKFSADFGGLYNLLIDDHKLLAHGVTVTEYEDGTKVIVNAGNTPFYYTDSNNSVIINNDDYIVLKSGGKN